MMVDGRTKIYPSKRDGWLVAAIWLAVAGMLVGLVGVLSTPGPPLERFGGAAVILAAVGFTLWVYRSTYYTLTDTELIIRSGPFRWRVALDSIDEVKPSRNPISSPAFSLDRLHIRHRGSRMGVLISPRDKTAFLLDLVARASGLKQEGDRVRRE